MNGPECKGADPNCLSVVINEAQYRHVLSVCSSDTVVIGTPVGRCSLSEVIGVVIGHESETLPTHAKKVHRKGSNRVKNVDSFC